MQQAPSKPTIVSQWQWQRNYHYLRYAILAFFLVTIASLPNWLQSEFISVKTVGRFGVILSLLCLFMDLRNYRLYRDEEDFIRQHLGKPDYPFPAVTWMLSLFYIGVIVISIQLITRNGAQYVTLTDDGAKRLGHGQTIKCDEKIIHLPNGWTKVKDSAGVWFLIRNEEIKEVRRASSPLI